MPKPKTIGDEVFYFLERKGLAEKNGEFRTGRNGKVQPVWAITQLVNGLLNPVNWTPIWRPGRQN